MLSEPLFLTRFRPQLSFILPPTHSYNTGLCGDARKMNDAAIERANCGSGGIGEHSVNVHASARARLCHDVARAGLQIRRWPLLCLSSQI